MCEACEKNHYHLWQFLLIGMVVCLTVIWLSWKTARGHHERVSRSFNATNLWFNVVIDDTTHEWVAVAPDGTRYKLRAERLIDVSGNKTN